MGKQDELQPIIVKKVIKKGDGHHGGAWKVAYADFVTAMMAFFLLMWLVNMTTDEAKEVIAAFYDPARDRVSESTSGAGGVMGGLSMSPEGAMADQLQMPVPPRDSGSMRQEQEFGEASRNIQNLEAQLRAQEDSNFEDAQRELEKAMRENPELEELARHLHIDITPEGLRIQIIDQDGRPMFPSGSANMLPHMKTLLTKVAETVRDMPNDISVRGHTDAVPYPPGASYTNWELSADRANAARRTLLDENITESRLSNVIGMADRDPFIEDDPRDAQNRRISIIMLRETVEQAFDRGAFGDNAARPAPRQAEPPPASFQRTPGSVYFP